MSGGSGGTLSTWLVIVGVFAAGALGGAAARSLVWVGSEGPRLSMSDEGEHREGSERRRGGRSRGSFGSPDGFVKHLVGKLELSDEQAAQIRSILEARETESEALFRSIEPQLREAIQRAQEEIREVLSDDQRTQFDEVVREGRRRFGHDTFRRGSSRGSRTDGPPSDGPPSRQ